MGISAWVRSSVKAAVLGGFADAVSELQGMTTPTVEQPTLLLGVKAEDSEEEAPAHRNGRKAKV